jgi:hypothetical protein
MQQINRIMFPTVAIGDIHGLTVWKKVCSDNPGSRYVLLGDYLDSFEPMDGILLLQNLSEIIQLKNRIRTM